MFEVAWLFAPNDKLLNTPHSLLTFNDWVFMIYYCLVGENIFHKKKETKYKAVMDSQKYEPKYWWGKQA